jgi:hypothetical protein
MEITMMLPDFTRIMWSSSKAQKVWEPRIQQIVSGWDLIERFSVIDKKRKSALQFINPENLPSLTRWALDHAVFVLPLSQTGSTNQYSASSLAVTEGQSWTYRVAITQFEYIRAWTVAWETQDNQTMGELLGFPICCQKFFDETWGKGSVDPTYHMNITPGPVNILLRWLGVRLIPHMPCGFNCKASFEQMKMFALIGKEHGFTKEIAWAEEILSWPIEWSALHGIAEIKTPILKIATRTDYSSAKKTIRLEGSSYPLEGASGNIFPYQRPETVKSITLHKSFKKAFERQNSNELVSWTENGFSSESAMHNGHAMILAQLLSSPPQGLTLDLGCGNGALLKHIRSRYNCKILGIEIDKTKVRDSWVAVGSLSEIENLVTEEVDTILVSQRRFEEMPTLEEWVKTHCRQVIVYSYDEPQFARVIYGSIYTHRNTANVLSFSRR